MSVTSSSAINTLAYIYEGDGLVLPSLLVTLYTPRLRRLFPPQDLACAVLGNLFCSPDALAMAEGAGHVDDLDSPDNVVADKILVSLGEQAYFVYQR